MDLAWHMTKDLFQDFPNGIFNRIARIDRALNSPDLDLTETLGRPNRIYIGDEFCPARLPGPSTLTKIIQFIEKNTLSLTLLTPVMTDNGIEGCKSLFDRLNRWNPKSEVVVNDIGVLFFLKKKYPEFKISMGRLFNKGFKDPRLEAKDIPVSEKMNGILNDCSFEQRNIQVLAKGLEVRALERDLLPYADPDGVGASRLKTAVYLPFGYVTTGRACFTAGLNHNPEARFQLSNRCASPCVDQCLELKHSSLAFKLKLFQKGNAIFYLYTLPMIKSLLEKAQENQFRLVFQGGLL